MDVKHLLKDHAYQNVPLNFDEAYALGRYALQGCAGDPLAQIQSITVLSTLHNKATYAWKWDIRMEEHHGHSLPKSSAEQIAGICAAIFDHDIAKSEFGFLEPNVDFVMDNCGMGGDLVVTANVSTLAAFIAASDGIPMCKHGSPANADRGQYGSSDFVSKICGINTCADRAEVITCLEKHHFAYTEALDTRYKRIHMQTHEVAQLPHMNDIIGPITNPVSPKILTRRVLGVNQLIPPRIIAEVYMILNAQGTTNLKHGLFVRGFADESRINGMDEASVCHGGTQVSELRDGEIFDYDLDAESFDIHAVPITAIRPEGDKGEYSLKLLMGETNGERMNMVLANAALLYYVAGRTTTFPEGFEMAKAAFESGRPLKTMQAVAKMLPRP
ncbi:hypothetical protein HON36_01685 [Candidatus Parcubacteria bacterium]|nr:hypothetical protein [Candidatus Parcubacteria bacterium]MBT7228743.1 hypothetical protein [Candidatus Parcubacteria bacterium]